MYKYIWLIFSLIIYGSSIAGIQPSLQNKSDQIKQGVAGTTAFEWECFRAATSESKAKGSPYKTNEIRVF